MPDTSSPWSHVGIAQDMNSILAVDGLHYDAARQALASIKKLEPKIRRALQRFERLKNRPASSDEIESIGIQMEGAEYDIGVAYGPYLRLIASVHVLAAASLEAHINIVAQAVLKETKWASFQWDSLEKKWKTIPKLMKLRRFNVTKEPFTGFKRLIDRRNDLMHYKPLCDLWEPGKVPAFLGSLGLTHKAAKESLSVAGKMIQELARRMAVSAPSWLRKSDVSYFELEGQRWQ
jgi:hypothetical protein